jgi:hypothetical protein
MIIKPMPSPSGTNREKLFRGMAYDAVGPTPTNRGAMGTEPDPVTAIVDWCRENLPAVDVTRLCQALGSMNSEPPPAADDQPSVDPMQTRGRAPGARVSMDSAHMRSLDKRFGLGRIGIA